MRSLRARLLVLVLGGACLSLLAGGVTLHQITRGRLERQFRDTLLAQARTLGASLVLDRGGIEVEAGDGRGLPAIYLVASREGEPLVAQGRFRWEGAAPTPEREGAWVWSSVELGDDDDGQAVTVCVRVRPEADDEGQTGRADDGPLVWVTLVADRGPLDRALRTIAAAILATGAAVLATTAGLIWWGVRVGLRPLDRLAERMGRIRPDSPEPVGDPARAPEELRPVYGALDGMLARIRETMERERRFTDAAAHELRTPIAELRTTIDVARRWPEPARVAAAIGRADLITDRMAGLIESLLLLSRSPGDVASGATARLDLAGSIGAEVSRTGDAAEAAGLRVGVSCRSAGGAWMVPEPVVTIGLRNLLSNALEYTARGGTIEISVGEAGGARELRVSNGPVALGEAEVSRLFEPFWRAESSRSSRTHSGLGLTVVRHVCAGCGLSCEAALRDGRLSVIIRERGRPDGDGGG